jgi:hypothetical protein
MDPNEFSPRIQEEAFEERLEAKIRVLRRQMIAFSVAMGPSCGLRVGGFAKPFSLTGKVKRNRLIVAQDSSALGRVRSPSGPELPRPLIAKHGRLGDATLPALRFGPATGRRTENRRQPPLVTRPQKGASARTTRKATPARHRRNPMSCGLRQDIPCNEGGLRPFRSSRP